jgi:hypothetical protein
VGQFDPHLLPLLDRFHTPSGDLLISQTAPVQVSAIDPVEGKLSQEGAVVAIPFWSWQSGSAALLFLLLSQLALSDAFLLPLVALFWGGVVTIIDDPLPPQVVLRPANESIARDAI